MVKKNVKKKDIDVEKVSKEKKRAIKENKSTKNEIEKGKQKPVKSSKDVLTKQNILLEKTEKKRDGFKLPIIIILLVVVVVLLCFLLSKVFKFPKSPVENNVVQTVANADEIAEKLNIPPIKEPEVASDLEYSIEGSDTGKMSYTKVVTDGRVMNFILKFSPSSEENMQDLEKHEWGVPIYMKVVCEDGSEIEVESLVAVDESNVMKSEWVDNSLYYTMVTDNLVTREDFLQEVNRVIIANHIEF